MRPGPGAPQGSLRPAGSIAGASQGSGPWKGLWPGHGWGLAGLVAPRVSEPPRASRPQESELLRLQAFRLFSALAKAVRSSKKHFFKEEVRKAWVPLLLHCQDPCPDAAQVSCSLGSGPQRRAPTNPDPSALPHPAPLMGPEAARRTGERDRSG